MSNPRNMFEEQSDRFSVDPYIIVSESFLLSLLGTGENHRNVAAFLLYHTYNLDFLLKLQNMSAISKIFRNSVQNLRIQKNKNKHAKTIEYIGVKVLTVKLGNIFKRLLLLLTTRPWEEWKSTNAINWTTTRKIPSFEHISPETFIFIPKSCYVG